MIDIIGNLESNAITLLFGIVGGIIVGLIASYLVAEREGKQYQTKSENRQT